MLCKKCGAQNEEDVKICAACGEALEEEAQEKAENENILSEDAAVEAAEEPAEEIASDEVLDEEAGEALNEDNAEDGEENDSEEAEEILPEEAQAPSKIKRIAGVVIALAAIWLVFFCTMNIQKSDKKIDYETHPVVYMKDGYTLMVKMPDKNNSYELTDDLAGEVKISEDGKYIFYGENSTGEDTFTLMRSKSGKKNAKKLDSGIEKYEIAPDGSFAVYEKNNELYLHDLKKSKKLASDVTGFKIAENSEAIIYSTLKEDKANVFVCEASVKAKASKVDDDITLDDVILNVNEDTGYASYDGSIYYIEEGKLFCKKGSKSKEKLLDDVKEAAYIGDSLFAAAGKAESKSYKDIFEDDCKEEDSNFKDNGDKEKAAIHNIRDNVRYMINGSSYMGGADEANVKVAEYSLYSIKGKKVKKLAGGFTETSLENQLLYKGKKSEKIKLSSIKTMEKALKVSEMIGKDAGNMLGTPCVIKENGKIVELKSLKTENVDGIVVSEDEKHLYCSTNLKYNDNNDIVFELKQYKLSDKNISAEKKISADVINYVFAEDGSVFVNLDDGNKKSLSAYKNKLVKIDENVKKPTYADNAVYFFKNVDNAKGEGTLMKYVAGAKKARKIDENVYMYTFVQKGDNVCYYVKAHNDKEDYGDLYMAKGNKKPKFVDDEVEVIK